MPPAGFEPAVPASERPPTHPVDRAVTGIGCIRTEKLIGAQPIKKFTICGIRTEKLIGAQPVRKFTTCCGTLKIVRPLLVLVFETDESGLQP